MYSWLCKLVSPIKISLTKKSTSGLFFQCQHPLGSRSEIPNVFLFFSWVNEDMYPPDSVEQLQKAGIEFQKHEEYRILPNNFAELMITSGLVLSPETKWISFCRWVVCHFMVDLGNMFHEILIHSTLHHAWCLEKNFHATIILFSITGLICRSFFSYIQTLTDHNLWTTLFHSGYDFGYFVKLLTAESLPTTEDGFFPF